MQSPVALIRAEWVRAAAFIVVTAGLSLMATVDIRGQTSLWLTGLVIAIAGAGGLLGAGLVLPDVRRLADAVIRWRPAEILRAVVDLNQIPAAPAAHRIPRVIANVFGPLSAVAGIVVVARLIAS